MNLKGKIMHDGIERTYYIHLPPGFSKREPSPLVFALHGGSGRANKFEEQVSDSTLTRAADARGIVLVFPQGVDRLWCDGRLEHLDSDEVYDDVGFISKIIDVMVDEFNIDPERVYSTGISNGGFMSIRLAIDLSDKIAAIAPVTASLSQALKDKLPDKPISVMIVNGTEDPLVPYDGGHIRLFKFGRSRGKILSTDETVKFFLDHNGCSEQPEIKRLPDKDPNDGASVEINNYKCSRSGTEVTMVKIIGGGHTWPGGKQYIGKWYIGTVCRDINASEMILDFFLRHSLQN